MPSFDVVSEVDLQEVRNAVDQSNREIGTRFDFKGSDAHVEQAEEKVTLVAKTDFQVKQMLDIVENKLIKRGIAMGSLAVGNMETSLNQAKQTITIKQGLDSDIAKKLSKAIKDNKMKVQVAIQGEQLRVTGKKRDDLQEVIALLKDQKITQQPLQFTNYRD